MNYWKQYDWDYLSDMLDIPPNKETEDYELRGEYIPKDVLECSCGNFCLDCLGISCREFM